MYKILTSNASCESAMELRTAIEKQLGLSEKTILVSKSSRNCQEDTVLLRYGCEYGHLAEEPDWGSPEFTRLCIDKKAFLEAIGGLVLTPHFHNDHLPTSWPVLLRSTLTGRKSEGVTLCHNADDMRKAWKPGSWWTHYIKHSMEIRVLWVLDTGDDNHVVRIYKRVPLESTGMNTDEFVCRGGNVERILKNCCNYPKVIHILDVIEDTLLEFGGKFVGLDMIYSDEKKDWVVLEGNSGPWLSKPAAEWLANEFIQDQELLAEDFGE